MFLATSLSLHLNNLNNKMELIYEYLLLFPNEQLKIWKKPDVILSKTYISIDIFLYINVKPVHVCVAQRKKKQNHKA